MTISRHPARVLLTIFSGPEKYVPNRQPTTREWVGSHLGPMRMLMPFVAERPCKKYAATLRAGT